MIDVLIVHHGDSCLLRQTLVALDTTASLPFTMYLWLNAPDDATKTDVARLYQFGGGGSRFVFDASETNVGFIIPNNRLYERTIKRGSTAPYVLLLNNDVILKPGWDIVLLAEMLHDDRLAAVGFSGGMLGPDGVGCAGASGYEVDYIEGWCLLLRRSAVDAVAEGGPLFNEQRQRFAYAEDSELCLRLRQGGWNILALPNPGERFATHLRGQTTQKVAQDPVNQMILAEAFRDNHAYLLERHGAYLAERRMRQ